MADENPQGPTPATDSPVEGADTPEAVAEQLPEKARHIYLIGYPKIIFLYPTFFMALIAGLVMYFGGDTEQEAGRTGEVVTLIFLGVLTLNLCVITFDFPRTTSLTLFFFIAMVVMALILTFSLDPDLLPAVGEFFQHLRPWANHQFYFLFAVIWFALYIAVLIAVRYDYWEVRPDELLHHHGLLSDLKRYPAPNLRIDKEINDVFEYFLLRSGRLIIHARHESRAIVLDNVLFINHKEEMLTRMLGALQVSVRGDE